MDFQDAPVVVKPTAGGVRVAIVGAVHTNTAWLERELEKVIGAKPSAVELDLARMPFLSSSGLGVLVTFRRAVLNYGGTFRVVAVTKAVFGTLKFAHLDGVFQIDPVVVGEGER
jgi:anti-sigma B factor antagonist